LKSYWNQHLIIIHSTRHMMQTIAWQAQQAQQQQ
jgi:hypothetical protein